ncbi:MAG: hypothetical protein RhofKO_14350 [Rhodothermales bacterium]
MLAAIADESLTQQSQPCTAVHLTLQPVHLSLHLTITPVASHGSYQDCQCTLTFTDLLKERKVAISREGKRRWIDNTLVEQLWRSLKYEEIYLKAYKSVTKAETSIGNYVAYFDQRAAAQFAGSSGARHRIL